MSASAGLPLAAPPAASRPCRVDPRMFSSEEAKPNLDPELSRRKIAGRSMVDAKGVQWHSEHAQSWNDNSPSEVDREADGETIHAQDRSATKEGSAQPPEVTMDNEDGKNGAFYAQVSGASNISAMSRTSNNSASHESLSRQASAIDKLVNTISFQAVKKAMKEAVQECKFCVSIADPKGTDYPLIAVSEEFEAMTGYRRTEILGVNCRFLNQGCDLDPGQLMGLRMASETGAPFTALLPNRKKSGELFLNLLDLRGLTIARNLKTGDDVWFLIGIQADMSELADDEDELAEHMEEVKVLADEIRVTIKKELQQMALIGYTATVESLEDLQKKDSGDKPSMWELYAEPMWRPGSDLGQRREADYSEVEQKSYGTSPVMDRAASSTAQSTATTAPEVVGNSTASTRGVTQEPDDRPNPGSSTGETLVPLHEQSGSVVASASTGRDILLLALGVSAVGLTLTMFGRWIARRRV